MPNTLPSKVGESSQPVKKTQSSSKRTSSESSKDSDRYEPPVVSSAEEINTEGKRWYELLQEKIGFDVVAKEWMTNHPELVNENKSEVLIRLACEVCLAKNTEYDPENENEEQKNKYIRFDTQRIFALFEVANELMDLSDRKNFVEFICQKGNVQLLEMICKKEKKDKKGCNNNIDQQYGWQGVFTSYSKLVDLLQYVINSQCSSEIVLCIAEKIYGCAHIFYNGEQYLAPCAVTNMKGNFNYRDSVVKELLKQVINLGYKDTVSVMLAGDIYHSIRLMKWQGFQEEQEFIEAYDMIKETVADVINSWVEGCKDDIRRLLDQGIEIEINEMSKESLIFQLEYLAEEVKKETTQKKERLVQELKKLGKEKGKVRLRSTIVGALISTLFFNYQDKAIKGGPFTLKMSVRDNSEKGKILDKLNKKISKGESIDSTILELVKLLHLSNHVKGNWFFREVLAKVVNENLDKLKSVCAAICKEPMEELLKDEKVHEDVVNVLEFFGVEVLSSQITTSETPSSSAIIADHFKKDINVYSEKEAKGDCSSDELAFSGLTRKIIRDLEEKKGLADEEKKALISKALSEIKRGINILADKTAVKIDIKDIFLSFELINSKIEKEQKREVIELVCQKGDVQLLEMICKQDRKEQNSIALNQYKWKVIFTGYSKLTDLLQYVIDNQCSPKIVLCLAEKMYGYAHIFYNGKQYLSKRKAKDMKKNFNYQGSVVKELLKKVIKLGYKDTVSVMLSGDIYHSIRLMKWKVFKEKPEFHEAYDMVKETVADVISSWVENEKSRKDDLRRLLDQGIKIEINEMSKESLIFQLEYLGEEVKKETTQKKERLVQELKKLGKEKGKVRLRSTIVGALISTLFFNYQDKAIKGGPFTLKMSVRDNSEKGKILDKLNKKISSGESIEDIVLKLIQPLNSANHVTNNWFFREVLAKVVNENLDKLKAVCAAICKEPMEELLRGEEVHEDVIDVLQFFGVEKDFLLLRKSTTNVAVSVSVKSIDESLSDTSEKSVSSSSQQSLADDRPKNSSALQTRGSKSLPHPSTESRETQEQLGIRKSVPTLKSQKSHLASSSKLTEKNNEGAMQKNYGQGEKAYYSLERRDSVPSLSGSDIYWRSKMEKSQQTGMLSKIRSRQKGLLQKKPSDDRLPKISHLDDAHSERYRKVFLNKLFNYNKFLDVSALLKEDQNSGVGSPQLNTSSSASSGTSPIASPDRLNDSRDQVFEDDPYLDGMQDYTKGLELLKEGDENRGKDKIRNAATKGFEPAMYAYAIIKFKEVMEGNIVKNLSGVDCDSKEAVKEAVECMVNSGTSFFPLNSFILGIMELYNVGNCSNVIQTVSQKSWKIHFADVLRATKGTPMMNLIAEQNLLSFIGSANLDFTEPKDYLEIVGKAEGIKELESIVDHVKYELARDVILHKGNYIVARFLFEELSFKVSSGGKFLYPDAQFSYAIALFIGKLTENEKEQKIYDLLSKADSCEHLEARLFLGMLLFKKGYEFCKSNNHWNYLENYLNVVHDDKSIKQKYLKEKISVFIAYEYINNSSFYVRYDEQKAKDILQQNSDQNELEKLAKAIAKGKEECGNLLNDTIKTFKSIIETIKKDEDLDGSCLKEKELQGMLEQLRKKLKSSGLVIKESKEIAIFLEKLNKASVFKDRELLTMQNLLSVLKEEVGMQLNNPFQREILELLENLDMECTGLRMQHSSRQRSNSLPSTAAKSRTTVQHSVVEVSHAYSSISSSEESLKNLMPTLSFSDTSDQPARSSGLVSSTANSSELPNFASNLSPISKAPDTKLSEPSTENQSLQKKL